MDADRFDDLLRSLSNTPSRRSVLRLLAGSAFGGALGWLGLSDTEAKKKRKKNKKPALNAFGCVNVGKPCRGKDAKCCSGVCQGKKPKKGEKDKSKCVAHNTGVCTPERDLCRVGAPASLCNPDAACLATTGSAGFCGSFVGVTPNNCQPCGKDKDCEALGFGVGAACVILHGGFCSGPGNSCAGINGSTGTACFPPGA